MATAQSVIRLSNSELNSSSKAGLHIQTTRLLLLVIAVWFSHQLAPPAASAQELLLQLDPAKTAAEISLPANLHTVKGSFVAKRGVIHYDPATGKAGGEIVFDAASGKTGNDSRDRKMHKDVIESLRFPEISFYPDRAEGVLSDSGESTLQVHGRFMLHGDEHEVTVPVLLGVQGSAWTARVSFNVPYVKWGLKNPSVLLLRVGNEVRVDFRTAGNLEKEPLPH